MVQRGVQRTQLRVVNELERNVQAKRTQETRHASGPHVDLPRSAPEAEHSLQHPSGVPFPQGLQRSVSAANGNLQPHHALGRGGVYGCEHV